MTPPPLTLIMAGGVGSRFWPASRESRPKQFLDILGTGSSLLQMTFDRFQHLTPAERIYVVTLEKYQDAILAQLPKLKPDQIICEPSRNNTGPCVAYASMKLYQQNPDAVCFVTPADHLIVKETEFLHLAEKAISFARENPALVTLGITPTRPDTGYGYIEYERASVIPGVHQVSRFVEKPQLEVAQKYIRAGNFLWNSGMFAWTLKSVLDAYKKHAPGIYDILSPGMEVMNTPGEEAFINKNYPKTEKTSVDFAIMERAHNVYTIPADIGWTDLGTWASLYSHLDKDADQNVVLADHAILRSCEGCLVRTSSGRLVVAKGLKNYIVIGDSESVVIYPMDDEQEIREVTRVIKDRNWKTFL